MTTTKFPFAVYAIDPSGIPYVVALGNDPAVAQGANLFRGQSLTVTEALHKANTDTTGACFFDFDEAEQLRRWGKVRIGRGPIPDEFAAQIREEKKTQWRLDRQELIAANPHLGRLSGAAKLIAQLDEALAE